MANRLFIDNAFDKSQCIDQRGRDVELGSFLVEKRVNASAIEEQISKTHSVHFWTE